jgi:hypothetical protein
MVLEDSGDKLWGRELRGRDKAKENDRKRRRGLKSNVAYLDEDRKKREPMCTYFVCSNARAAT